LSVSKRLLILLINYWPVLHGVAIGLTLFLPWAGLGWRVLAGMLLLYLLPPLAGTCLRRLAPVREGRIPIGGRDFFIWWALLNLQLIFCRFPALEEGLRLVPGAYGLWLRLWGARVGRLIYWGAGLKILDRSFLRIGDGVIFGADVRLNPHVLAMNGRKEMELILATVVIGERAVVGAYSMLTAGSVIAPDECTRAFLISPPFGQWKDGVRIVKRDVAP